jgi:tyrosyl-tRNA synthetase
MDEIRRDGAEIIPEEDLERKLKKSLATGEPLRVKQGFDPTRPDLHIGHAVSMRKLRTFQELGHDVIFVVGDYTARVGDPSGRSEVRPRLTPEEIDANARTYVEQVAHILDVSRSRIEHNSKWLAPLDLAGILELSATYTVARMLERDDFAKRYAENRPISIMEFMYPLMQAYDSVALHADVELGGTDQRFNLLVGRTVQERYGQEPQVCLIMPLLRGTDGETKMSKSYDNYIGISEAPEQQFGKTMSIPDSLLEEWYTLSGLRGEALAQGLRMIASDPYQAKRALGRAIVGMYHGEDAARSAEAHFDKLFRDHAAPDEMPELRLADVASALKRDPNTNEILLSSILVSAGLAKSNSEASRLLQEGAVAFKLGEGDEWIVSTDRAATLPAEASRTGAIVRRGKRQFARVIP